jgi:Mlc titration factor MtfA (ptsG expression regulator)
MTTVQIIALFVILLAIAWGWWRLFRTKPLNLPDFQKSWREILEREVQFYAQLSPADKNQFESDIQEFLAEVDITGVEVEVDDTDRLLVAASAVIPIFKFPDWRYRNLNEVLLYGDSFNHEYETAKGEERNILGMVGEGSMQRMMILSKPSLRQGFDNRSSKSNVGIHEFVHLLDKADGATDGVPELFLSQPYIIPWVKVMHAEIRAIKEGESDINPYGSKNEAEFLSVVSEYFFKQPELLEEKHPELYAMLERMFRKGEGDG